MGVSATNTASCRWIASRRRRRPFQSGVLLCALALSLTRILAAGETFAVTIQSLDEPPVAAQLRELAPDAATFVDREGGSYQRPISDLISLDFIPPASPSTNQPAWLLFANGDRLAATTVGVEADAFTVRWPLMTPPQALRVPLETVTAAILRLPALNRDAGELIAELSTAVFADDTILTTEETRLTGELGPSLADSFQLETAVGRVPIEAARITAIALDSSLVVPSQIEGHAALLTWRDGSWLTVQDLRMDSDGKVSARTLFGSELRCAAADVKRIAFRHPRIVDVAGLDPSRIELTPYLDRDRPVRTNRSVRGGFLRLGGSEWPRGLGMVSGSACTYDLAGEYVSFQATVGIDAAAGRGGSVRFIVETDGKPADSTPIVRGGDDPLPIGPIPLGGAHTLTLRVEFADRGDILDFADWCEPLLVRRASSVSPRANPPAIGGATP